MTESIKELIRQASAGRLATAADAEGKKVADAASKVHINLSGYCLFQ